MDADDWERVRWGPVEFGSMVAVIDGFRVGLDSNSTEFESNGEQARGNREQNKPPVRGRWRLACWAVSTMIRRSVGLLSKEKGRSM
jgi:hypothetical protein